MAADTLGKVLNPGHQKANPSKNRRLELRAGVLGNQPLFPLQAQGEPTSPPVLPRETRSFWVILQLLEGLGSSRWLCPSLVSRSP